MESAKRIKVLLTVGATSALLSNYLILKKSARLCPLDFAEERIVSDNRNLEQKLTDASRKHPLCFRIPVTGQFYIALTRHSFNDHICGRIRTVHDCHILHFESLEETFKQFESPSRLCIVNDDELSRKFFKFYFKTNSIAAVSAILTSR